ncbi:hypothetical protein HPP92_022126 [Vanilla planifolia]|uniref:Uncharacterized protein n=1 Tax=Vanilla planifolia TaxID=51239 RepID=A0A835UBM3_VANPL|nr:hypothetical protein HPP92_022126 [Vanilla planifolia]
MDENDCQQMVYVAKKQGIKGEHRLNKTPLIEVRSLADTIITISLEGLKLQCENNGFLNVMEADNSIVWFWQPVPVQISENHISKQRLNKEIKTQQIGTPSRLSYFKHGINFSSHFPHVDIKPSGFTSIQKSRVVNLNTRKDEFSRTKGHANAPLYPFIDTVKKDENIED